MINCTPETPPKKMEESPLKDNESKSKLIIKAKKNANSITKEKRGKAQKPNSVKKSQVTCGNIKSMFAFMSKPKDQH